MKKRKKEKSKTINETGKKQKQKQKILQDINKIDDNNIEIGRD